MEIQKKILLAGVGLVVVLSAMQFILPRENEKNAQAQLRIGAGDDISGYLVQEILSQQDSPVQLSEQSMEGYEFQDCWSNTAQWALRSEEIDMALSCSHQAAHLVEEDDRFVIYAPAIMNAEVVAYQGDIQQIKTLGVGQQRLYLQNLAKEAYPQIETVEEIKPNMLPYTLSTGEIDAAVMDVTKATLVPEFSFAPLSDHDYISYVLIVREDLIGTEKFDQFIKSYNRSVEQLKDGQKLQQDLGMDAQFWKQVKFLTMDSYE